MGSKREAKRDRRARRDANKRPCNLPDFSKPVFANPVKNDGTQAPVAGVSNAAVPLTAHRSYFLNLPPFKGQRNTEEHRQDLLHWSEYNREHPKIGHEFVVFQYMNNHNQVIEEALLDGNTTVLMHHKGDITLPSECNGMAYQGHGTRREQEDQALRLYDSCNNKANVKQSGDVFYSAQRLANFEARSSFFAAGRGTSAIDFAEGVRQGFEGKAKTVDKVGLTSLWRTQIKAIDDELAIEYKKAGSAKMRTNAGLLAAFASYHQADAQRTRFFMKMYYRSHGDGDTGLPWVGLWHKIAAETKNTGGSRAVTRAVLEWALHAISKVSDSDIRCGIDSGVYTSALGDSWNRIKMESFWKKYVDID